MHNVQPRYLTDPRFNSTVTQIPLPARGAAPPVAVTSQPVVAKETTQPNAPAPAAPEKKAPKKKEKKGMLLGCRYSSGLINDKHVNIDAHVLMGLFWKNF